MQKLVGTKTVDKYIEICEHCQKELGWNYITFDNVWWSWGDEFGHEYHFCSVDCMNAELTNEDFGYSGEDATFKISLTQPEMKEFLKRLGYTGDNNNDV